MSLLTIAQAQAVGVGIGLSDADLQVILDREEALLVRQFGAVYTGAAISETVHGGGRSLYLKRGIASVTSIVEYLYAGDTAPTTLTSQDYFVWAAEGRIERLPYGTTAASRWGGVAIVTYVPTDDRDLWRAVLIDLVKISTEEPSAGGSVSGLGFSVGASTGATNQSAGALRSAALARIGWLST